MSQKEEKRIIFKDGVRTIQRASSSELLFLEIVSLFYSLVTMKEPETTANPYLETISSSRIPFLTFFWHSGKEIWQSTSELDGESGWWDSVLRMM